MRFLLFFHLRKEEICAVVQLFWNIHNFSSFSFPPYFRYVQKVPPMTLIVWHFWFFPLPQLSGCCCCCHIDFTRFPHFFALSIFFISNPSMSMAYNSIFLPWLSLFLIYTFPPFLPFVFVHMCYTIRSFLWALQFFSSYFVRDEAFIL